MFGKKKTKTLTMKEYDDLQAKALEAVNAHKCLTDFGVPKEGDVMARVVTLSELSQKAVEEFKAETLKRVLNSLRGLHPRRIAAPENPHET
jgi:hypothetical protein